MRIAERRARFFREASAYDTICVPGIPSLIESNAHHWKNSGVEPYIATEFIEGPSLRRWREAREQVELDAAIETSTKLLAIMRRAPSTCVPTRWSGSGTGATVSAEATVSVSGVRPRARRCRRTRSESAPIGSHPAGAILWPRVTAHAFVHVTGLHIIAERCQTRTSLAAPRVEPDPSFCRSKNIPASCTTSRRILHTPNIARPTARAAHTESFSVRASTQKASVRRVRRPDPCEEDARAPMGATKPCNQGTGEPSHKRFMQHSGIPGTIDYTESQLLLRANDGRFWDQSGITDDEAAKYGIRHVGTISIARSSKSPTYAAKCVCFSAIASGPK